MCIICGYGKCLPPCGEKSKKKQKDPEIEAFKKVVLPVLVWVILYRSP
jgi:predicted nucleic acid-binding Zn ribbon protein